MVESESDKSEVGETESPMSERPRKSESKMRRSQERAKAKSEMRTVERRIKHPSYNRFWNMLQVMPVDEFMKLYEPVKLKTSMLSSVMRKLVEMKGKEYERLGVVGREIQKIESESDKTQTVENE